MLNVIKGKRAAFAVFEPLLCGLVAADIEVPCLAGDIGEVLCGVDEYFARIKFGTNGRRFIGEADARIKFGRNEQSV